MTNVKDVALGPMFGPKGQCSDGGHRISDDTALRETLALSLLRCQACCDLFDFGAGEALSDPSPPQLAPHRSLEAMIANRSLSLPRLTRTNDDRLEFPWWGHTS